MGMLSQTARLYRFGAPAAGSYFEFVRASGFAGGQQSPNDPKAAATAENLRRQA